ncbi:MAG: hypothetical protein AAB316_13345, partial [Bacteroidota bacterium]
MPLHQVGSVAADGLIWVEMGGERLADLVEVELSFAHQIQFVGHHEAMARRSPDELQDHFSQLHFPDGRLLLLDHRSGNGGAKRLLIRILVPFGNANHDVRRLACLSVGYGEQKL